MQMKSFINIMQITWLISLSFYSKVFDEYSEDLVSVTQSCPTICNRLDCSPPDSSVHGIFSARILEWVAIPFSRGSFWPRDWTWVSCIAGKFFTIWATRKIPEDLEQKLMEDHEHQVATLGCSLQAVGNLWRFWSAKWPNKNVLFRRQVCCHVRTATLSILFSESLLNLFPPPVLCILAWRILWTEEPHGLQLWGCKELDVAEWLSTHVLVL